MQVEIREESNGFEIKRQIVTVLKPEDFFPRFIDEDEEETPSEVRARVLREAEKLRQEAEATFSTSTAI